MSYTKRIDRANPGCLLLPIDLSESMQEQFGGAEGNKSKAACVPEIMNRLLQNLIVKCAATEGVRNYFEVGVIGYNQPEQHKTRIESAFGGALAGRPLVPIAEIANNPLRVEERVMQVPDGAGGVVSKTVKFPIWFEPVAEGGTPMCEALRYTSEVLVPWIAAHPHSYPPIVIHITDGEATDGNPEPYAEAIKKLATDDGNVLLFNCHISSRKGASIMFPEQENRLPDEFAQLLFRMSSMMPEKMRQAAQDQGFTIGEQARGFAFQADFVDLVHFLNIGTEGNLR